MDELEVPLPAVISVFDEGDQVGRVRTAAGEELRFGRTACHELTPTEGLAVFVTIVGPHPLGGRKALKLRLDATSESAARAAAEQQAKAARQAAESRREALTPLLVEEIITKRVREAVLPDEDHDADEQLLYALVDDLELVGPSPMHVVAITKGIAQSHPLAHFGSPGPLVHFVEKIPAYEQSLFEQAAATPTSHFLWMLARCVNGDRAEVAAQALAILRGYSTNAALPESLRTRAAGFVAEQDRPSS